MEDTVKPTFVDDSHVDSGKIKYLVMGVVIWLVVYSVKLLKRSPHLNFIVMNWTYFIANIFKNFEANWRWTFTFKLCWKSSPTPYIAVPTRTVQTTKAGETFPGAVLSRLPKWKTSIFPSQKLRNFSVQSSGNNNSSNFAKFWSVLSLPESRPLYFAFILSVCVDDFYLGDFVRFLLSEYWLWTPVQLGAKYSLKSKVCLHCY